MHILQSRQIRLSEEEAKEVLSKLNLSKAQLPKILASDANLPENCAVGDIIKIERKEGETAAVYFRVVV